MKKSRICEKNTIFFFLITKHSLEVFTPLLSPADQYLFLLLPSRKELVAYDLNMMVDITVRDLGLQLPDFAFVIGPNSGGLLSESFVFFPFVDELALMEQNGDDHRALPSSKLYGLPEMKFQYVFLGREIKCVLHAPCIYIFLCDFPA